MAFRKGENPNRPKFGAEIKVDPIRDLNAIQRIKQLLVHEDRMRDFCLFTMGVNTAWRANELLALKVGHVRRLKVWDDLSKKQSKNGKYRITPINPMVFRAIEFWLAIYKDGKKDDAPLFPSRMGGALTVPTVSTMVKQWCGRAGLPGHYGSHTLRKTWGYHQRMTFDAPLSLLVKAFGHSSERQTLDYLGIQPQEIAELYWREL